MTQRNGKSLSNDENDRLDLVSSALYRDLYSTRASKGDLKLILHSLSDDYDWTGIRKRCESLT